MIFEDDNDEACQCGHGMAGFEGVRYQKGFGLLGNLFTKALPYLKQFGKYIGKKLLGVGSDIASDIYDRKPIKESVKNRLKATASTVANDGMKKLQEVLQKGNGKRRRVIGKKKKLNKHNRKAGKRTCKVIKKKTNKRKKKVVKKKSASTLSFLS